MNAPPSPFNILPLIVMGSWAKIQLVKQSLWTLREAGTKEGRWNTTSGPLILLGDRASFVSERSGRTMEPWKSLGASSCFDAI